MPRAGLLADDRNLESVLVLVQTWVVSAYSGHMVEPAITPVEIGAALRAAADGGDTVENVADKARGR